MAGSLHRQWMYKRRNPDGHGLRNEWIQGVNMFDEFAQNQEEYRVNGVYRCPCVKCKNMQYFTPDIVKSHLYRKGFVKNYWYWTSHGEEDHSEVGGASSSQSMNFGTEGVKLKKSATIAAARYSSAEHFDPREQAHLFNQSITKQTEAITQLSRKQEKTERMMKKVLRFLKGQSAGSSSKVNLDAEDEQDSENDNDDPMNLSDSE